MDEICKTNVYKNITYYKNSTDGKLSLQTTVLDSLCPNDCSDHGNCSNSTCTCFEDYTGADCAVSLNDSPIVYGIRKSGLCDVRRRPCENVGIYAFPLLDSENLTCHVQEYKVIFRQCRHICHLLLCPFFNKKNKTIYYIPSSPFPMFH